MWIKECRKLYEQFVEHVSEKPTQPRRLEEALLEAKAKRQVGSEELDIIEKSCHWPYPTWWLKLSILFGEPITLPANLSSLEGKQKAVADIQERLKHIEIVSIILRFIFPEEFGIISPPVTGLLNLVPGEDHEQQYLNYLSALDKLRQRYGVFERIADFDMALWTAAHLHGTEYTALLDEMYQDKDFQEIRLENLMEGLGRYGKRTERERLTLAKVFWKHDHVLAGLIAARCFESVVEKIAKQYGIHCPVRRPGESLLGPRVKKIKNSRDILEELKVSSDELDKWHGWRNKAVHGEPEITKSESEKFIRQVERLLA